MVILGGWAFLMSEVPLYTLNPAPEARNPKPTTLKPQTCTLKPVPSTNSPATLPTPKSPIMNAVTRQRFRGGLVFKAHRLCASLNSTLESNKEEEEDTSTLNLTL